MHMQFVLGVLVVSVALPGLAAEEWLSRGSKDWAPTVYKKTGVGTANAVAEARVMGGEIEGWCANWAPGDRDCVRAQMASEDARRIYRASADCTRGRITPIDGETYTLAGRWPQNSMGAGRTRWRDASGAIVGADNASGGLGISQQWEVLCPEAPPRKAAAAPPAGSTTPAPRPGPANVMPAPPGVATSFRVGEIVFARSGPAWVRGRVTAIGRVAGARGTELAYDVRLENGQSGRLPPHLLRKAPQR